ncbi:MAG: DNA recombination/repair protein RecA [Chloroflexota bacterium]|nr:DNA recombination/repair protein RecA [Chloroflexota bacterium]
MAKEHKKKVIVKGRQEFRDAFQVKYKTEGVEIQPASEMENATAIPTGIISFDVATGCGGFPKGRVVEIYGPESSGKSLLSLCAVAYAQKMFDATALYFDVEGGTPVEWLKTLGIDLDNFDIVGAGLTAEQNYDAMVAAIESGAYTYIIVDSLAAMVPRAELEGTIDKAYMAEAARASSKGIRKIIATLGALKEDGPCCIFINQTRMKPGVMFGSPEDTPGGKALKFYSAQRFRVNKKSQSQITENGDVVGHSIEVKNKKNKLGPPLREGEFFINYTQGLDIVKSIMTMLKARKMYVKKGQKYVLTIENEVFEFDTVNKIKDAVTDDAEFQAKIYKALIFKYIGPSSEKDTASKSKENVDEFPKFTGEAESDEID